jgi:hypothetical protein
MRILLIVDMRAGLESVIPPTLLRKSVAVILCGNRRKSDGG